MKRLFWNQDEHRLRSLWRVLLTVVMTVAFSLLPLYGLRRILHDERLFVGLAPCLVLLGTLAGVAVAARRLDRRSLADFGLQMDRRWWTDLGFGMLLGALLLSSVFFCHWLLGWVEVVGWYQQGDPDEAFHTVIASLAVLFICVGAYEEIAYRGYLLRNLAEGLNFRQVGSGRALVLALTLTAVAFGVAHFGNPYASLPSTTNTVLAGIIFGLGFLLTGRLGLPIGIHITWNFFQGPVFGYPVSGLTFASRILVIKQSGPELWTGGSYGPEAGLLTSGLLLFGVLWMLVWIRFRYGQISLFRALAEPPSSSLANSTAPVLNTAER